jgi:hypothetical protein
VRNRLGAHREDLYRLVSALLRDETVDALALERILGPRADYVSPNGSAP